jgi:hypothetical protein
MVLAGHGPTLRLERGSVKRILPSKHSFWLRIAKRQEDRWPALERKRGTNEESVMSRPPAYDEAYPQELWKHERAHLRARVPERELPEDRPSNEVVGVALSGGGIRSATFCLGVFQALAQLGRLGGIDYISTVSGGGYFGSFLGRLYQRRQINSGEQVRSLLDPTASPAQRPPEIPDVVAWLRENGRYLSPSGAGDLLLNAAIMLRNWVTIQVVLASFVLLVLMSGQLPRLALELWPSGASAVPPSAAGCRDVLCGSGWLWWSPWIVVPGFTLVWWAAPLAWAFWLTGGWKHRKIIEWPVWGLVLTTAVAAGLAVRGQPLVWVGGGVLVAIGLTVVFWAIALSEARSNPDDFLSPDSQRVFEIDRQRNFLSMQLKVALVTTGGLLAFALVDSVGQTLYLVGMRSPESPFRYLYSVLGMLAGAVAFAQRIAVALAGRANGGRLRLPVAALLTTGALAVTTLLLVSLSVLAHGLAWQFQEPAGGPAIAWATPAPSRATINVQIPQTAGGAVTATTVLPVPGERTTTRTCGAPRLGPCVRGGSDLLFTGLVWAILVLFAFAFGRCWPFINRSSLHSMYSARLTRAYLGASNPRRVVGRERITEVVAGDNIDPADYWPPPEPGRDPKARPLHLINVTINETVDGRSNVQQQDRKGTGLALGPCSFSVGIRHHAVFPSHAVFRSADSAAPSPSPGVTVFPKAQPGAAGPGYQVFTGAIADHGWRGGEQLPVGAWTGISGAAFSTGLGARTNLGLSLLSGLTNVRLGYWWDCGVDPRWRPGRVRRPSFLERQFSVQSYLLSELLSRFYGTSRRHWYLSDGGHFENMGAYELIRRRLGRIVLIDAEADPHYTFDGLANLIRKARLDFGAEIEFLGDRALDGAVPNSHRRLFGSLEQLRRGKWTQEPVKERQTDQLRLTVEEPVDEARPSLAHAALARVTYPDDRGWEGWLLYVKPTLIGDEPPDVVQYHRAHLPFPQETTADQFFDEAQWESYRMLGYHIAFDVFGTGGAAATGPTAVPPSPAARIFGTS